MYDQTFSVSDIVTCKEFARQLSVIAEVGCLSFFFGGGGCSFLEVESGWFGGIWVSLKGGEALLQLFAVG